MPDGKSQMESWYPYGYVPGFIPGAGRVAPEYWPTIPYAPVAPAKGKEPWPAKKKEPWPVSETVTPEKEYQLLPADWQEMFPKAPKRFPPEKYRPVSWEDITTGDIEFMLRQPEQFAEWVRHQSVEKAIEEYGQKYAGEELRSLPGNLEMFTPESLVDWLGYTSYGAIIVDAGGRQLSHAELNTLAKTNPDAVITIVYARGGGETEYIDTNAMTALSIELPEEPRPAQEGLPPGWERMSPSERASWGEFTVRGEEAKTAWESFESKSSDILKDATKENYIEKSLALYEAGLEDTTRDPYWTFAKAKGMVFEQLSPEDQEAVTAGWQGTPELYKPPGAEGLTEEEYSEMMRRMALAAGIRGFTEEEGERVEGLSSSLEPYGLTILRNYPYITPLTEALLMRIPTDVLEQMRLYLEGRGVSWSDYLAFSRNLYGGPTTYPGRYAVPRQWG